MNAASKPSDPARDFCQWPYERPRNLPKDAWRQEKILFDFLKARSCLSSVETILRRIQSIQGRFNTVWGLKSDGTTRSLELYFYDYDREARKFSSSDILNEAGVNLASSLILDDTADYFMWSFELNLFEDVSINDIDIYCAGTGGTISGGTCFKVSEFGVELKNLYYFFDCANDQNAIKEQLAAGPRFKGWKKFPQSLSPGALDEEIYVVSVKRHLDSIYFSRVEIDRCASMMHKFGFFHDLAEYLISNQKHLNHHLFDIGIDYTADRDGSYITKKVAVYGIL